MIYLKWSVSKAGDLVIDTNRAGQEELKSQQGGDDFVSDSFMVDTFECLIANSELDWVEPLEVAALTDAPMLGIRGQEKKLPEDADSRNYRVTHGDENGLYFEPVNKVWWYPNYAVRSPQEDLAEFGQVIFQKGD